MTRPAVETPRRGIFARREDPLGGGPGTRSLEGIRRRTLVRSGLAIGLGAFVVAAIPLAARRRREADRLVRRTLPVMGTIAEFAVVAPEPAQGHAAIDAAHDELVRIERVMTRYACDSEVGRVNRAAAACATAVSAETAVVAAEAIRWAEASEGIFDPCLGAAEDAWDVEHRTEPPAEASYRRYAGRRLYRSLDVDRHRGAPVVVRRDADVCLDLGAIAKGYAVDRAAEVLRALGVRDALVNVGGDLVALGHNADGEPWRVGVRSPSDPEGVSSTIAASDVAIATSGDYERYFDWQGRRYHHILDPRTAAPRETDAHSVTIVAPTCMAADAAATACFGMDPARAEALLRRRSPGARLGAVA